MDFGGFTFTPDGVALVAAGFVAAGAALGLLVAAVGAMVDAIRF